MSYLLIYYLLSALCLHISRPLRPHSLVSHVEIRTTLHPGEEGLSMSLCHTESTHHGTLTQCLQQHCQWGSAHRLCLDRWKGKKSAVEQPQSQIKYKRILHLDSLSSLFLFSWNQLRLISPTVTLFIANL